VGAGEERGREERRRRRRRRRLALLVKIEGDPLNTTRATPLRSNHGPMRA